MSDYLGLTETDYKKYTGFLIREVRKYYDEPHRFYHTINHIIEMVEASKIQDHNLLLAIIYHDACYNPKNINNEEVSCQIFEENFKESIEGKEKLPEIDIAIVKKLIMATKTHEYCDDPLTNTIIDLDLNIFTKSIVKLIEYEHQIFKEYQFANIQEYITKRVDFLNSIKEKYKKTHWYNKDVKNNINSLIEYVKSRKYKIGIFAGSFDPFHIGHQNILNKAEKVFDKVIIARGCNPDKGESRYRLPTSLFNEQIKYTGLVTDLFKNKLDNVNLFLIRGMRNVYDSGYEENLRKTILDIDPTIEFTYFYCDSKFEHISSSQIKGLLKFDTSFTKYIVE